ncbi:hypothetical protein O1W69_00115 [Chlamydia sp. 12-01]|uniref:hypothetical protein n=1 Tax=Chlamydia sp. 12-01 TaxID=3002742 RepID=UPI0035D4465E
MAGVSGVGGGGGPGKIPPHGNGDDKKAGSAKFGAHNIVYGSQNGNRSRSSSSSSGSSIEERTQLLMEQGFKVLTPEEVKEAQEASISKDGQSKPGLLSRMWSAVKGIFTGGRKSKEVQKPMEISSPIIPGYKKHGVRLPEVRSHTLFQSESSQGDFSIDAGDTDVSDIEDDEVPTGRLVSIDTSDTDSISSERGASSRTSRKSLAESVRGWWKYTTKKSEGPEDGLVGLTLDELKHMVQTFDNMIEDADTPQEKQLFTEYRDGYQKRIDDLSKRAGSLSRSTFYMLDDSMNLDTSSTKYTDASGEAVFLDTDGDLSNVFEDVLLDVAQLGDDSDSILEGVGEDAQKVLDEAVKLRLEFDAGISESISPPLRERIHNALEKLRRGIINILTIIKYGLVALARLVKNGLRALGELVKRCCVHKQDHYSFLPNDTEYAEEVAKFIQKHTESDDPYPKGTLVIPDSIVNAWVNGVPEVVYVTNVEGKYGYEVVRTQGYDQDGTYEIVGASWLPYGNTKLEDSDSTPKLPDNHPNDSDYGNMVGRPNPEDPYARINRNRNVGGSIYDRIRGSRRKKEEEPIYDLPSNQNRMSIKREDLGHIYDAPRPIRPTSDESTGGDSDGVYNIPTGPLSFDNEIYDDGYLVPDNQLGLALGVTPGFASAVGAVSFSVEIDQLIEENRLRTEGATSRRPLPPVPVHPLLNPLANRALPPRPGVPYDPLANRALPVPPPLQTPPPTPYGNNRMMQMMKLVQERGQKYKDRRKDN